MRLSGQTLPYRRRALMGAVAAVSVMGITIHSNATTVAWRGTNSGFAGADGTTFTLPANWSGNAAPVAADEALFDDGSPAAALNCNPAGVSVATVTFQNSNLY